MCGICKDKGIPPVAISPGKIAQNQWHILYATFTGVVQGRGSLPSKGWLEFSSFQFLAFRTVCPALVSTTELQIAHFFRMDDGLCGGISKVMLALEGLPIDLIGVFTKFLSL